VCGGGGREGVGRVKEWVTSKQNQPGVCHTMALPFPLKSIFRQKKNNENSNISLCKNIIFKKKSSKRNQNP